MYKKYGYNKTDKITVFYKSLFLLIFTANVLEELHRGILLQNLTYNITFNSKDK